VAVSQDLTDLNEAGARAVHLGRGAVTQPVRAQLGHAGALAGAHHDMTDRPSAHRAIGGTGVHEHVAALAARAAAPQVGRQRLADVDRQRQPIAPAALPTTTSSPARQSMSSSISAATSPARNPSRTRTVKIA